MATTYLVLIVYLLAALIAGFFGSYIREKGKNVATREDIEDITRKVESIKHELDRATHASKQQFDAEFIIYREIWEKLVVVRRTFVELHPFSDVIRSLEAQEETQQQREKAFNSAYDEFIHAVHRNEPFYSDEVHKALLAIIGVCIDAKFDFEFPDAGTNYWQRVRGNKEKLHESINTACTSIRSRVQHLLSS
jgi:hypothetical protein